MNTTRTIDVTTPIPGLIFERMQGEERLGRPFDFHVDLLGKDANIKLSDAIGRPLTVALSMGSATPRYFNGIITHFSQVGWTGDLFRYSARVQSWLWLLTRTTNSRIFQQQDYPTLLDVLEEIFDEHGFSGDVDDSGIDKGQHLCPEFLVQYNESDYAFVCRILERAGIYFSFDHADGKHTLVMHEGIAQKPVPGYETIPFYSPGSGSASPDRDHQFIQAWSMSVEVRAGAYVAKEFDFEQPATPLLSAARSATDNPYGDQEMFEFPSRYIDKDERQRYVQRRLEEQQLSYEIADGMGNARGITPGKLFSLTDHPTLDQNRKYLVIGAAYVLTQSTNATSADDGADEFTCHLTAVDAAVVFRTPVTTPRPRVQGPQTAIVTGPENEEIWTDKYGRVKVQFHWDRLTGGDENSSCWVRVSQVWAGAKWGAMHIPRIGQEVIVDFLEGDPDQPIITGRVYNKSQMPPYDLPGNQTQSGIKSRSTPKGTPSNFNEIRFEDKKGHEELFIQAERAQTTLVKGSQSISVGGDRSVSVTGKETIDVKKTRTTTVTLKETEHFKDAREMNVDLTDTETITGKMTGTYKAGRELTVTQFDDTTVNGGNKNTTVHGQFNITADEHFKVMQGGDQLYINGQFYVESVGEVQLKNKQSQIDLNAGVLKITSATEITLTCGSSSISLKSDGTITVSGVKVTVTGTAEVDVNGAQVKLNA